MKRVSLYFFVITLIVGLLVGCMLFSPKEPDPVEKLRPGEVITGIDGVSIGAPAGALDKEIELLIEKTADPTEENPFPGYLTNADIKGDFYQITSTENYWTPHSEYLLIGLPVPEGETTDDLAFAVLCRAGLNAHSDTTMQWQPLRGVYDSESGLFVTLLPFVGTTPQTFVLVEGLGYTTIEVQDHENIDLQSLEIAGFRVECIDFGEGECTQAHIQMTEEALNEAYELYVNTLGFNEPRLRKTLVYAQLGGSVPIYGWLPVYEYELRKGDIRKSEYIPDMQIAYTNFEGHPDSPETLVTVHEFFHALQFGYERIRDNWGDESTVWGVLEGTAVAAENSLSGLTRSNTTILDTIFEVHRSPLDVTKSLFRNTRPGAAKLTDYQTQDFWIYLAKRMNTTKPHLDLFIPLFERGGLLEDIDDFLKEEGTFESLGEAYWQWAKNQSFEKQVILGKDESDNDVPEGEPCEWSGHGIPSFVHYNQGSEEMTEEINIEPLSSHVFSISLNTGDRSYAVTASVESTDPDIQYKIYGLADDEDYDCFDDSFDNMPRTFTVSDTQVIIHTLISNTSVHEQSETTTIRLAEQVSKPHPPTVKKISGPEGSISDHSITFVWSGDGEIDRYEFSKDGGVWIDHELNTSYTWEGYSEGEHTFEVRAEDDRGAHSNSLIWSFTVYRSDKHGGTLYLCTGSGPRTLNPLWAQETSSTDITSLNHQSLINSDHTGMPSIPALASEWWFSEDGKTAHFRIRQGLQWSDGTPFTIEDVRWTFEELLFVNEHTANGNVPYKDSYGNLPIVNVNGNVISFTWTEPNVWSGRAIGWANIMPKHVLEQAVDEGRIAEVWSLAEWDQVVGMGPFLVSEFVEGVRIKLSRNPYYWEFDSEGARLPYLDNVEYVFSDFGLLLFEAGEIDMFGPRAGDWQRIVDQADEKGWIYGQGGPGLGSDFITFNMVNDDPAKRDWFRNPYFRRAFQYAMDKDSIISTIFNNLGTAIYGPVSPSSGFFNPEILDEFPYQYSITRARLELSQGGFDWDDDGKLIDSEGRLVEFELSTNANNATRETICTIIVDGGEKMGMTINYVPQDFNTLVGKLNMPDYDTILIGLTGSVDPGSGWNVWRMDGGLHFFNYTPEAKPGVVDPETYEAFDWEIRIHDIFVESVSETDHQKRWDLFAEFQMLVAEHQPLVYTVTQNYLYVHKDTVHLANPFPSPAAGMLWRIEKIWKE